MRVRRIVKLAGEILFLTSLIWCVAASDAAAVHKIVFWGILVCGAVLGGLQAVWRRHPATPLPVSVVSGLLEWILSWVPSRHGVAGVIRVDQADLRHRAARGTETPRTSSSSNPTHPAVPAPMTVRLLFFDHYRDLAETDAMVVEFFESVCVADLVRELRTRKDGLSHLPPKPVVFVNMHYAALATRLNDGDLVAFIPPLVGR